MIVSSFDAMACKQSLGMNSAYVILDNKRKK